MRENIMRENIMDVGEEITIRAKIVDFDSNPHGTSVKVEIKGFVDNNHVE
jgi:hypothetical protein